MAYLTANHVFQTAMRVEADDRLSAQERSVVLVSRNDPLRSLRPRHAHSRVLLYLFGIEAPRHLADPRLETLRRYAVTYRLRDPRMGGIEAAALEAGFSAGQLTRTRHMVDGARASHPRRNVRGMIRHVLLALAAILMLCGATIWLSPRLDSPLIAFVFVAVALLSFASFAGSEPARR